MVRLYLVRHGRTEWNELGKYQGQSDIALSPIGEEQAKRLAEHFPAKKLDAVYASDLKRAYSTAEGVALVRHARQINPLIRAEATPHHFSLTEEAVIRCGALANHSHRLSKSKKLVVLGEKDVYEPLCRNCYNEAIKAEKA